MKVERRELECRGNWPRFLSGVCSIIVETGRIPSMPFLVRKGIFLRNQWPPGFDSALCDKAEFIAFIEAVHRVVSRGFQQKIVHVNEALEILREEIPWASAYRPKFRPHWTKWGQKFLRRIFQIAHVNLEPRIRDLVESLLGWSREGDSTVRNSRSEITEVVSRKCVVCNAQAIAGENFCYFHQSK